LIGSTYWNKNPTPRWVTADLGGWQPVSSSPPRPCIFRPWATACDTITVSSNKASGTAGNTSSQTTGSAGRFSRNEPGVFAPLRETLLTNGDHYMHLADLRSYLEADQRLVELYADPDAWARKAILNVAGSGKFSSDRTIAEYAADIWNAKPCPVP